MNQNNELKYRKLNVPSILISILGFFVSLYALILHIRNLMEPGHGSLCDINATFNCSSVISSSYGEFASIPLGAYGMTYFIILLSAAVLPKVSIVSTKQLAKLELLLGFVGFIFVISLFYISHNILKTICPTCTIIHILVTLYFIVKSIQFFKYKNDPNSTLENNDYFIRFLAIAICLGLPPLAAGLIAPIVIDKFFPSYSHSQNKVTNQAQSLTQINQITKLTEDKLNPLLEAKAKMITFNKTNYVGDGEDYHRGNDEAKIIVQMFSDFGCPHCKQANDELLQAQDRVGLDKVLLVYRFFPLSNKCNPFVPSEGWYPYSCSLVQAVRCAGAQGKFWEFKEWGFAGQNWTDEQRATGFSMAGMKEEAKNLGINADIFEQCINNGVELTKIKNDADIANKMNIKGTPLILINGQEYNGPHSAAAFVQVFKNY